jgi:hypothetical protein
MSKYQNPLNIYSFAQFVDSVKAAKFLEIDLRPFDFVDVYATMGLALLVRSSCCEGHYPRIYAPTSDEVKAYLARQNFFEVISPWYAIPQEFKDLKERRWDGNPRVAPLTLIERELNVTPVVFRIQRLLVSAEFGVPTAVADGVSKILTELLQNIPQHASIGQDWEEAGIAVLQAYSDRLELAVGDAGIGMKTSLQGNPVARGRSDQELQILTLQHGLSRVPTKGRGTGLPSVATTIARLGGRLRLQSGNCVTYVTAMGYRSKPCTVFRGTQLQIRVPCKG